MDYDDEDTVEREGPQPFDEDAEDEEQPAKRTKKTTSTEADELVNEKRGYTEQERNMIEEWLRKNKPKSENQENKED